MTKRISSLRVIEVLALAAPLVISAQQQELRTFTMSSEWIIPRAQWAEYEVFTPYVLKE